MLQLIVSRFWVMSLQAGILILIVLLARLLLKKYPKIYTYCLWALVGLRLLCPVFIETSYSLQPDMQGFVETVVRETDDTQGQQKQPMQELEQEAVQSSVQQQLGKDVIQNNVTEQTSGESTVKPSQSAAASNRQDAYDRIQEEIRRQETQGDWVKQEDIAGVENTGAVDHVNEQYQEQHMSDIVTAVSDSEATVGSENDDRSLGHEQIFNILAMVYLIGTALVALFYIIQYIGIRRRIGLAVKDEGNVWLCENIASPFVIGLIKPRIILPYGLNEEEKSHVLKHERTHIKHNDQIIRMVGMICIVLHWWNPLVWLAVHKMNQDMEMFCDEAALKDATVLEKKSYANTLLAFSVRNSSFSVGLAFGESNTEKRVENIMKKRKTSYIIIGAVAVLAVFCAVAFMTIPGRDDEKNNINNEQESTADNKEQTTTDNVENPTTDSNTTDTTEATTDSEATTNNGEKEPPVTDITPVVIPTIDAGYGCVVGVDANGKAVYTRSNFATGLSDEMIKEIDTWDNLVSVSAGNGGVVGVKNDGTVKFVSSSYPKKDIIEQLTGVAVAECDDRYIFLLMEDGTTHCYSLFGESNRDHITWKNIIQVDVYDSVYIGLKADKTVITAGNMDYADYGLSNVSTWTDIEMVATGGYHAVGLRSDGTVVAAGFNLHGECDVSSWTDIVYIDAGTFFTIGVKSDGTVVATGLNKDEMMRGLDTWTDIQYVSAGEGFVTGVNDKGEVRIGGWLNDMSTDSIAEVTMPSVSVNVDTSLKLTKIQQQTSNVVIEDTGVQKNVENGKIDTGDMVMDIPESIADHIRYSINEDGFTIYNKGDAGALYIEKDNKVSCEYAHIGTASKLSMKEAIMTLAYAIVPTKLVGGSDVQNSVNKAFCDVWEQVCKLEGIENEYTEYKFVDETGDSYLGGIDSFSELLEKHDDSLVYPDEYVYVMWFASDVQTLNWEYFNYYNLVRKEIEPALLSARYGKGPIDTEAIIATGDKTSIDDQIILIEQNMDMWKLSPDYANEVYSYAVTDLDGNGRLELIASNMGGTGYFTYSKFYEVNEQYDGLVECETNFVEGNSQPDVIEPYVEMYYDWERKINFYLVYDLNKLSMGEYHIIQNAMYLVDGKIEVVPLAKEIQYYTAEDSSVVYQNAYGTEISEKMFVEMPEHTFGCADVYGVNFEWREMSELDDANYKAIREMLKGSYEGFTMNEIYNTDEVANLRNRESAYMKVVRNIYNHHRFPNDENYDFIEGSDMSENTFAIYDIDGDEVDELIINYVTTYNAGMVQKIYDYNYVTAGVREEFSEYPFTTS